MQLLRRFVGFWIDFIIGDAWEVAAGIGLALVVCALAVERWDDQGVLGLVLVATILGVTWLALMRATAHERRAAAPAERAEPLSAIGE